MYVLRNMRVVAPLAVAQWLGYSLLNHYPPVASRRLPLAPLDRWIPFWPWTVWGYFLLIAMAIVLPLGIRDWFLFRRVLVAYAMAILTAGLFFAVWPTRYPRPPWPLDDSISSAAYRWLTLVDTPECCFPSSHVIAPTLAGLALWQDGRRGGLWLPVVLAACCLTILTTKQHYFWDLLGGLTTALAAMVLACRWMPRPAEPWEHVKRTVPREAAREAGQHSPMR